MAGLSFNPLTGVTAPTTQELREELAQAYKNAFRKNDDDPELNTDPASPMGQVIDAHVAESEAANAEVIFLANQFSPDTARGLFLDALVSLYFLKRKTSEPTVVTCTCTGLKGTVIPYGVIVEDIEGNKLRHNAAGGVSIGDNGTVTTTFSTVEHGAIAIAANSVTNIVTVIPGWDSITNPAPGVIGRDRESDAELRNRRSESVAINAQGNVDAIEAEIRSIDGVIDAVVFENITNQEQTQYGLTLEPHSIGISVYGGEDADIAQAIFAKKAGGVGTSGGYEVSYVDSEHLNAIYTYKITRPVATAFNVQVTLWTDDVDATTQEAIQAAVVSSFFGMTDTSDRVGMAETVYASRFVAPIAAVTSIPIRSVLISLGDGSLSDNVTINATTVPTISADNVSVLANSGG